VHRPIRSKWVCKCCKTLVQEPVQPKVIDKGMPAPGLAALTLISRFVDHIPRDWQESNDARSGVPAPRSTWATSSGAGGAELQPLFDLLREFVLGSQVLHVDETPVNMLDLPQGCADGVAHPPEQPHRRVAATTLAATGLTLLSPLRVSVVSIGTLCHGGVPGRLW